MSLPEDVREPLEEALGASRDKATDMILADYDGMRVLLSFGGYGCNYFRTGAASPLAQAEADDVPRKENSKQMRWALKKGERDRARAVSEQLQRSQNILAEDDGNAPQLRKKTYYTRGASWGITLEGGGELRDFSLYAEDIHLAATTKQKQRKTTTPNCIPHSVRNKPFPASAAPRVWVVKATRKFAEILQERGVLRYLYD
eukprot:CAMPEP_0178989186 /NCGR_PEP_ID=MMETSP0795-20121207/4221_1 /TAXON_ID=88552 /ORGANISM="Amoebophrya sp., Strain Ameob2" /LENGTH=200 /DNA_ID=CAMNT_0020680533 /DNA_START=184 /DNA_END=788 /DNA_ORIENTATION=+